MLQELKIPPHQFLEMNRKEQAFIIASMITKSDELKEARKEMKY